MGIHRPLHPPLYHCPRCMHKSSNHNPQGKVVMIFASPERKKKKEKNGNERKKRREFRNLPAGRPILLRSALLFSSLAGFLSEHVSANRQHSPPTTLPPFWRRRITQNRRFADEPGGSESMSRGLLWRGTTWANSPLHWSLPWVILRSVTGHHDAQGALT